MKLSSRDRADIIATYRLARASMGDIDLATEAAAILTAETFGVTPGKVIALLFHGVDGPRKPPAVAESARGGMLIEMKRRSA